MTVPRAGDFWIRREPHPRSGNYTVMYILDVFNGSFVKTQTVSSHTYPDGDVVYNVNGSTSIWNNFLRDYRPARSSEVPNYYYGRVGQANPCAEQLWHRQEGTIVGDVWSDSIIHNAYEYLMGNKQPKEKPQKKRKGFATFVLEKGL